MLYRKDLEEIIDLQNPPQDEYEWQFFYTTLELLQEDEKSRIDFGSIKLASLTPFALGVHEGIHATTAALIGCRVDNIGYDRLSFYTSVSGDPIKTAVVSFAPHILALPAMYYWLYEDKEYWLLFLAPTIAEVFPYELFQNYGDFLNIAKIIAPGLSVILKYVLVGSYLTLSYLISKYVHNNKRKNKEKGRSQE